MDFNDFSVVFNVFIKIHENMHQCMLISKVEIMFNKHISNKCPKSFEINLPENVNLC